MTNDAKPDLVAALEEHYPGGTEGSEYASLLCDLMLWCRRHRVSPLRLAVTGFRKAGVLVPQENFPPGWKISAWIEESPERLPDADRDISREHRDRISRFEGLVWKMFRQIDSEEPAIDLLAELCKTIDDWKVMSEYLRASAEQWLTLLPWGAISGEQWYTIDEARNLMKDRKTADRAFYELGANPSNPEATVAGSQLIVWVMENGEHQLGASEE